MRSRVTLAAVVTVLLLQPAEARDRLEIVGAPVIGHFSKVVSERFARWTDFPSPRVQITGNGGGFVRFCAGIGEQHPDIVAASRPISDAEVAECKKNGIRSITEVRVGYEAIVLATGKSSGTFDLTPRQIFAALAKDVQADGEIVANPYVSWHEIDKTLPEHQIEFLGPAAGADLHQALVEDVLTAGCAQYPQFAALKDREKDLACSLIRTDGHYEGFREHDPQLVTQLMDKPGSIGVLAYSTLEEHGDAVAVLPIDGVLPSPDSIADGSYGPSRPLFLYTKNQHYQRIPGLLEYVDEYTSERTWEPDGYLIEEGLVPLADAERRAQRSNAIGFNPLWR